MVELGDSSDSDLDIHASTKMQYSSEAAYEECKRKTKRIFKHIDSYNAKVKNASLVDLYLDSDEDYEAGKMLLPPQTSLVPKNTLLQIG